MNLTFLYHRINDEKNSNSEEKIKEHLEYLAHHYKIILPGEKISFFKKNITLTFDDGYFDFYYYVYPLLKKLKIKAQLAIPVKFIVESTKIDPKTRFGVSYKSAMKEPFLQKVPFCTWEEIREMVGSGLVSIASHSFSHKNLLESDADLELEILESKKIIEEKIKQKISTFVYPMGKFNEKVHLHILKHYKYVMRIGSTFNLSWKNFNNVTYRILSDNLKSKDENLKCFAFISYLWFYILNTFRGR
jgi:peptidoglycan/xylan/chitin deacetylase (PgdA/CDA1 family)